MKIVDVKTLVARGRTIKNWVFVKIVTDEGVYGIGDPGGGNKALTAAACVNDMARLLIGQDPRRIQHIWQMLRKNAFSQGTVIDSAVSGIDMALWDILGKSLGVPVYQLLGGAVRDRLRVYASGFSSGARTLEQLQANAAAAVKEGYTALKFTPVGPADDGTTLERTFAKQAVARVRAVREAVGDEVDIALDFHGRLLPQESIPLLKMLAPVSNRASRRSATWHRLAYAVRPRKGDHVSDRYRLTLRDGDDAGDFVVAGAVHHRDRPDFPDRRGPALPG